jgi:hypothetical protein
MDDLLFLGDHATLRTLRGEAAAFLAELGLTIKDGGVLYATAGCGVRNEFNEPDPSFLKLLGLKSAEAVKDLAVIRPLIELPVAVPIGTITMDGAPIQAIGMKQTLVPDGAKVLGTWADGKAAVTERTLGKGKAYAVGTLAGCTYMKTGIPVQPFARGGNRSPVVTAGFDPAATKLVRLGVDAKPVAEQAVCSNPLVEAVVMDNAKGTVVTLVNWTQQPIAGLQVQVRMPAKPSKVRAVQAGKDLPVEYKDGILTVTTDLEWADYLLLFK